MFGYYLSVLREIPRTFRSALEGTVFWGGLLVSLIGLLSPSAWGLLQNGQVPRKVSLSVLGVVSFYGVLRANYRLYQRNADRVSMLEGLPSEKYKLLCDFQQHLVNLVDHPVVSRTDISDFQEYCGRVWERLEMQLFPLLHWDERVKLSDLHNRPGAWKDDTNASKAALHGLKNEIESMARTYRPASMPAITAS